MAAKRQIAWMKDSKPDLAQALAALAQEERRARGVYVVNSWSESTLAEKLAKVNRKLAKYGHGPAEPIAFTRSRRRVTTSYVDEAGKIVEVTLATLPYIESLVLIEAARIQLGDRRWIEGRVDRVGDGPDVVITPYGVPADDTTAIERLSQEAGQEIRCDHCRSNRRRNASWILRREDGHLFMVGDTCAKEYFGLNVAGLLNDLIDLDDDMGGGRTATAIDRVEMVAISIGAILKYGFVSQSSVYRINEARRSAGLGEYKTTTDFVDDLLDGKHGLERDLRTGATLEQASKDNPWGELANRLIRENIGKAEEVIEAITVAEPTTGFQANVVAAIRSMSYAKDWWKFQSLVVAGLAAHLKDTGHEQPELISYHKAKSTGENEPLEFASGHLGTQGDSVEIEATIEGVHWLNGDFGPYCRLTLRATSNHKCVYLGKAKIKQIDGEKVELEGGMVGARIRISGVIKKVERYNNVDQTLLGNAKMVIVSEG